MVCDRLKLVETQPMRPFGLFTIMRFVKDAADGTNAAGALEAHDNADSRLRASA